ELTAKLFSPNYAPSEEELGRVIHGGMEIVSPVFRLFPQEYWRPQIFQLFKTLRENYHLQFNESTGLHVHVGYGDREIPLPALLNIAAVLVIFEPVIDKIHVGHRGVSKPNIFLNSNQNNALLGHLTNVQVFERINGCKTFEALQHVVNLDDTDMGMPRCFKYNFMSLTDIVTMEFRQHAGVGDAEAVQNWILLGTTLVRRATEIGDKAIREFASKRQLGFKDLRRLINDPELMNYYRGKI
ncbi:hypothetical protein RUND412_010664, partial [Rhizina undulata]